MTPQKLLKPLIGALSALLIFTSQSLAQISLDERQQRNWERYYEEHQTHQLMMRLSATNKPQYFAIQGVNVIPMTGNGVLENQTVVIRNGRIFAIGAADEVPIPPDTNVITNASGKYLIPGLTEGHAHTQFSLSQFLVYLTRGVTTVREMDGFPWMLNARGMARQNRLLIPNLYVSGHILSNRAWGFFMTQVDTAEEVREQVFAQAAMGYDFIKVHNSMPEPLWSAMFEAANEVGLDVVGHIPNEITIKQAIASGLRTNEHFKGYIFDENLTITTQDYVNDSRGSEMWQAPSFSNHHEHLRGAEATALVETENSLRLVPRWMRKNWLSQADQEVDKVTELRQTIYPKSAEIFQNLRPVADRFFAGTDTGGYAFQVPGYALQEEIRIFESLGMTPHEALKTGTINAALAMRKEAEMGTIRVGRRADFVILDDNPLEDTENLKSIWGVGLRGIWLHHDQLTWIEDELEEIFSDDKAIPGADMENFETLVSEMEALKADGFPYPDYALEGIENFFNSLELGDLAARVDALQARPGVPIQTP